MEPRKIPDVFVGMPESLQDGNDREPKPTRIRNLAKLEKIQKERNQK